MMKVGLERAVENSRYRFRVIDIKRRYIQLDVICIEVILQLVFPDNAAKWEWSRWQMILRFTVILRNYGKVFAIELKGTCISP